MKRRILLSSVLALLILGTGISSVMAQKGKRFERMAERLSLTDSQKNELKGIMQTKRTKIESILTTEQKAELQALKPQINLNRKAFKSLNLSEEQKQEIRAIRQDTQQQISQILTPEQQEIFKEMRQNRQRNRQK